ncbi:reverse transcriptase-like protein [Exiguobacterium sp. S22-S28]|uniref:reverse transcriptase-like protein n=1 Tax=Exiguobacterium sp. S22-S28 TaxID=3342768 RepID=UPI00372CF143
MKQVYIARCDASNKGSEVIMSNVIVSPNQRLVFQSTNKASYTNVARAELQALHSLLSHARRQNIERLQAVSDCKTVVEVVLSPKRKFKGSDAKKMNGLLQKIRELILWFKEIKIMFKKRQHNVYADSLCHLSWAGIKFSKAGGEVNLDKPIKP